MVLVLVVGLLTISATSGLAKELICEVDYSQKGKVIILARGAADIRSLAVAAARTHASGRCQEMIFSSNPAFAKAVLGLEEERVVQYQKKGNSIWATIQKTYRVLEK